MITADLLQSATGCRRDRAELYAQPLRDACAYYGINTPQRLAAFLAQISHESGSLAYASEIWGPTAAQRTYEGRRALGNIQPGDGERYKGHGLIQVTGRANHVLARDRLRREFGAEVPDFEASPEALAQPRWACLSAADYWAANRCNELADKGDFEGITRRINGGMNGWDDRLRRWELAKRAIDTSEQPVEDPAETVQVQPDTIPAGEAPDWAPPQPKEPPMAAPLFLIPAAMELAKLIPKLGQMFASSEVAQRNVKAAEVVVSAVAGAVGASNAQEAVEKIQADPAALQAATKAVEGVWYQVSEAGGGGIDGARKADSAVRSAGDMLQSPSFWVACALLGLVYWMMGNVMGLYGAEMDEKVRSAIINGAQGMILGGVVGYFFGQTTSRNRTPQA